MPTMTYMPVPQDQAGGYGTYIAGANGYNRV
jgi:hypothetical protein